MKNIKEKNDFEEADSKSPTPFTSGSKRGIGVELSTLSERGNPKISTIRFFEQVKKKGFPHQ